MDRHNSKAIIFDLDGVIVDTARFHYLAWKKIAASYGFELLPEHNEKLKGVSRKDSLEKILRWADVILNEQEFGNLMNQKNQDYLSFVARMTPGDILVGVGEFVCKARKAGYKTAIGSASKNTPLILDKINFSEAFDAIVDGNQVNLAKPDPEVFTRAADLLEVVYRNCIVFEDSEAGIAAANRAGMISIGIGMSETLKEADWIFTGFPEISIEFINQVRK